MSPAAAPGKPAAPGRPGRPAAPGAPGPTGAPAAPGAGTHVRPARPDEAGLLIDFQLRLARETEELALDREALGRGVRAVFDDPTLGEYWVAEQDGRVAGCLLVTREWSDWSNGTVLWITSVYVLPEARRRGVFQALYQHLRHRVETTPGLAGLRLYASARNRRARAIYRHLGMSHGHYALYEWMKA
jgi:GNAT superfamily N-acetyltransferase